MFKRYISLYYSSINFQQTFFILVSLFFSIWNNPSEKRKTFADSVRKTFGDFMVFLFSTGRGAIAACLRSAGIGEGDEVIISSFNCIAVPTALLAVGAIPVYVDIDPVTLNVKPEAILNHLTPKTKAIVVQHTFGSSSDMYTILALLKDKNILVIEDCALSLGSKNNGTLLGSQADAAIFSLEQSKTLSTGWGGILIIKNKMLGEKILNDYENISEQKKGIIIRDSIQTAISAVCHHPSFHFIGKYVIYFFFKIRLFRYSTPHNEIEGNPGNNFINKLSGTQSILGLSQWKRLQVVADKCRTNAEKLRNVLNETNFITLADPRPGRDEAVSPRISFLVKKPSHFHSFFSEKGIETASWFDGPLSPLPDSDLFNYDAKQYPASFFISRHIVNLPCHSRLTPNDIGLISEAIREYSALNMQQDIFIHTN